MPPIDHDATHLIADWANELGFSEIAIADRVPPSVMEDYRAWLSAGYHGEMAFMAQHLDARERPERLVPGTLRVIVLRMDYLTVQAAGGGSEHTNDKTVAEIARYALGRDYHLLMRRRIARLAKRIRGHFGGSLGRAFVDSAPVLEKPLAAAAGLGWVGKHTNLLSRSGSWFLLGELFTDLPLPVGRAAANHCGRCSACIDGCPTAAIVAPWQLDARRCISYLTIELDGPIPLELRAGIGRRIFGCDECQLVCPWNRNPRPATEPDFLPRHQLDRARLVNLIGWDEAQYLRLSEGSALRRLGHLRWLRNLAVAIGNAPPDPSLRAALLRWANHPSEMVREHLQWALARWSP